jgi:hypothetical protein
VADNLARYFWTGQRLTTLGAIVASGGGAAIGFLIIGADIVEAVVIGAIHGSIVGVVVHRRTGKSTPAGGA